MLVVVVVCRIIVSAPDPVPFLWTLDFGFRTWMWDLDLGPGFGTWIWDLDLGLDLGLTITFKFKHFLRIKIPDDPIPANQSTHMDKNRRTE